MKRIIKYYGLPTLLWFTALIVKDKLTSFFNLLKHFDR